MSSSLWMDSKEDLSRLKNKIFCQVVVSFCVHYYLMPPRQWDSRLSHDTENEKPRKMSNLFIISTTDDLPPSSLDICQGLETFLVVTLGGEVEGGATGI